MVVLDLVNVRMAFILLVVVFLEFLELLVGLFSFGNLLLLVQILLVLIVIISRQSSLFRRINSVLIECIFYKILL